MKHTVRILNIIPVFPPARGFGGPLISTYEISKEFVKRGYDITVYTTNAYDPTRNFLGNAGPRFLDGIKVYYFKNYLRTNGLFISPHLIFYLLKNIGCFDLVFIHSWRGFQDLFGSCISYLFGVPYVLKTGGSLPRIMGKENLKKIYDYLFGFNILKKARKVIAVTDFEVTQFREMNVPTENVALIPNGIDLSKYSILPNVGTFKQKFGITKEEKIVLYLGRLHKIKGVDILIEAFAKVVTEIDDVKLVIVGPNDGILDDLLILVNNLGVENDVIFTGPLYGQEKNEAYVDSDIYVLPSRYEIFGLTVLEAYACSKPVIVSNVGGLKDLVVPGKTGLLCNPEDVEQFAISLLSLLTDGEKTKKMGMCGKKYVEENFSIEKIVDKFESLYNKII